MYFDCTRKLWTNSKDINILWKPEESLRCLMLLEKHLIENSAGFLLIVLPTPNLLPAIENLRARLLIVRVGSIIATRIEALTYLLKC
jgi:hypothetical protein